MKQETDTCQEPPDIRQEPSEAPRQEPPGDRERFRLDWRTVLMICIGVLAGSLFFGSLGVVIGLALFAPLGPFFGIVIAGVLVPAFSALSVSVIFLLLDE